MKKTLLIISVAILLAANAIGQTKLTENTIRIDKDEKGSPATVSDMEWMAGSWEGNALGGSVKEVWTKTEGGVMIGMFFLAKDNKPVFSEYLNFMVDEGELFLKLKHFNPDLTGWEEKDDLVSFRFIKKDGNRYYFQGLTFENAGKDAFNIYLAMRRKDKTYSEAVFKLKRSD